MTVSPLFMPIIQPICSYGSTFFSFSGPGLSRSGSFARTLFQKTWSWFRSRIPDRRNNYWSRATRLCGFRRWRHYAFRRVWSGDDVISYRTWTWAAKVMELTRGNYRARRFTGCSYNSYCRHTHIFHGIRLESCCCTWHDHLAFINGHRYANAQRKRPFKNKSRTRRVFSSPVSGYRCHPDARFIPIADRKHWRH